jgi:hypothetical protein
MSEPTPTLTPTPYEAVSIINNCDTVTLFDIGLRCNIEKNPTTSISNDGILSVLITGGTSPYTVYWNGLQGNQRLVGVGQGSYPVTVVDYYGDYTASTICNLIVATTTPVPTATPTPTPTPIVYPNLCFTSQGSTTTYGPIQFFWNGNTSNVNGKPTWSGTYSGTNLSLAWRLQPPRWEINGWSSIPGWNQSQGIPVSTSTSNTPLTNWSIVGGQNATTTMTQGVCPPFLPLRAFVSKQDSTCSSSNNGSITITADAGIPPYTYSINGGATYLPTNNFINLSPNTYSVVVKDNANPPNITPVNQVSITNLNQITNYNISAQLTNQISTGTGSKTFEWRLNITPPLPAGKSIRLAIQTSTNNFLSQPGNGTFTSTYEIKKNGTVFPPDGPQATISGGSVPRVGCSVFSRVFTQTNQYYGGGSPTFLTIGQGDVITGTITSSLVITNNQVVTNCATKLETESMVQLLSVVSTTGFTGCDRTTLTNLGGMSNVLP